jgi:transposase
MSIRRYGEWPACGPSSLLKHSRFGDDFVIQGFVANLGGSDAGQIRRSGWPVFVYFDQDAGAERPLRRIRELVRDVLGDLNRTFGRLYSSEGRPSVSPEQLLSALLLQAFYG